MMSVGSGVLFVSFEKTVILFHVLKVEDAESRTGVSSAYLCTSLLENAMLLFEFDLDIFTGTPESIKCIYICGYDVHGS